MLQARAENARQKSETFKHKDQKRYAVYRKMAEEFYVFARLVELCDTLQHEVQELYATLDAMESEQGFPENFTFPVPGKKYDVN